MNLRTEALRLVERADSDREISSVLRERVSRRKKLSVQSGTTFSAEVAAPGKRSWKDAWTALRHAECIAGDSGDDKHRRAAASPTLIAVAVNDIEDLIDFISDRPAKTSASEWTVNHVRLIVTPQIVCAREPLANVCILTRAAIIDYGITSWYTLRHEVRAKDYGSRSQRPAGQSPKGRAGRSQRDRSQGPGIAGCERSLRRAVEDAG